MKKVRIKFTESGAKFLNTWNRNMNNEYEKHFGTPYWNEEHPMPHIEAGSFDIMPYDSFLMLQSGLFLAVFPQPAVIIDKIWDEKG